MSKVVLERLSMLRKFLADKSLSAYITFSTDPHSGEYVPAHWESRKWISGFTGSAGTVVVTTDDAGLWTDSRYFLQAEEQLAGTGIRLFKERVEGTPTIAAWLGEVLVAGAKVGIDGYTTPLYLAESLKSELGDYGIELVLCDDPYSNIWHDRPAMPSGSPFLLPLEFAGEDILCKINRIRKTMDAGGADLVVISSLDEIAWALNMRGNDVHCNPLFLSYLLVSRGEVTLYIDRMKLTDEVREYLQVSEIIVREYSDIAKDLIVIHGMKVQMSSQVNVALYEAASSSNEVIVKASPVVEMKSVKNEVEMTGFRNAMIRDGVAMVKFLKWLGENVGTGKLTELNIDEKLYEFRASQKYFKGISFDTIAGYNEHGAIVHYEATEETSSDLKEEGLLLLDSGAHYLDGTTDITRTISLGALTEEQCVDYTLVLKGFIQLAMAEFPHGTCGTQLDVLARQFMWKYGVNYGHGTGHGAAHPAAVPLGLGPRTGRVSGHRLPAYLSGAVPPPLLGHRRSGL